MACTLGNFNVDEIIYGTAQTFEGELLYTLDQLSGASIEIASESTDITDKRGNIVRTIYRSKTGTFTATNAFLHPQVMNAASGSAIEIATNDHKILMPKIIVVSAGSVIQLEGDVDDSSVNVIGIYGNGANTPALSAALTEENIAVGSYYYNNSTNKLTLPAQVDSKNDPASYLVKYDRFAESGMKLINDADSFPQTVKLTLYCSIVDPCSDTLRAAYVVLPSFQASPETTISLSADEQEMEFSGSIQMNYCGDQKVLYYIYFPDENAVKTGIAA